MSAVPARQKVHVAVNGRTLCTSQNPLTNRLIALPFNTWRTHPEHARCKRCFGMLLKRTRAMLVAESQQAAERTDGRGGLS